MTKREATIARLFSRADFNFAPIGKVAFWIPHVWIPERSSLGRGEGAGVVAAMELKSMDRLRMFEIVLFFLERIYNVSSFRKIVINWKILKDVSLILTNNKPRLISMRKNLNSYATARQWRVDFVKSWKCFPCLHFRRGGEFRLVFCYYTGYLFAGNVFENFHCSIR